MTASTDEVVGVWRRAYTAHGRYHTQRTCVDAVQLTEAQMLLRVLRYLYGYLCAEEADYEINEYDHKVLRSWLVVREVPQDWRDKDTLLQLKMRGSSDPLLQALHVARELMRRGFCVTQRDDEEAEFTWHQLFQLVAELAYDDQRSARAIWLEDVMCDDVYFYETQEGQGDY